LKALQSLVSNQAVLDKLNLFPRLDSLQKTLALVGAQELKREIRTLQQMKEKLLVP